MKKTFLASMTLALAAYLLLPLAGVSAPLSERIRDKRSQVERARAREGVLTQDIAGLGTRIERLQGEIRGTQARLSRAEGQLNRARVELEQVRDRLEAARDRLERLRRELAKSKGVLAERLVEIYKADRPDALTVVLESDGFADLLERTEFLDRISDQDRLVVDRLRRLRDRAKRQADELAGLERRVRVTAQQILQRRNQIASARDQLVSSRASLASARSQRRSVLARVSGNRRRAQESLASLEREQAQIRSRLQAAAGGGSGGGMSAGPIRPGSGQLIWPINGPLTSPFGQRWGRLHAGVDISAPEGTPIRAAASGRVVLAGWQGGYGNYTCIQHSGSMSTCYGHQSRLGTSQGASVRQGQVMGYVGNTGHSFGAHLHFEVRIGGSPVNPMGYL